MFNQKNPLVRVAGRHTFKKERITLMKTPTKILGAILAFVMVGAFIVKLPVMQAQSADTPKGPVPVVVNPAPKQYRVIDISRLASNNSTSLAGTLENGLNELGNQGWTLVAVSGSFLIMMR